MTLRLPKDMYDQLKVAAQEDERTLHGYILVALREHLRLRKRREARRKELDTESAPVAAGE